MSDRIEIRLLTQPALPSGCVRRLALRMVGAAARAVRRHNERHQLAEMDQRMLRDIGIDPMLVWQERQKWWWQV